MPCGPILHLLPVPLAVGLILAQGKCSLQPQQLLPLPISPLTSVNRFTPATPLSHQLPGWLYAVEKQHLNLLGLFGAVLPPGLRRGTCSLNPLHPLHLLCHFHCQSPILLSSGYMEFLQAGGLELNKYSLDLFKHSETLRPGETISLLSPTSCVLQVIKLHPVIPTLSFVICLGEVYLFGKAPSLNAKTGLYNSIFYLALYIFHNVLFGF